MGLLEAFLWGLALAWGGCLVAIASMLHAAHFRFVKTLASQSNLLAEERKTGQSSRHDDPINSGSPYDRRWS